MTGTTAADDNYPTIDGHFSGTGPIAGGTFVNLQVTGRGGVPASGVGAVAINVAVTNPTAASFLTVFPAGAPRPTAANLNFTAGQTVPNLVVVKVGNDGQISLFNYAGTVDVVVDVQGWFPAGPSFTGLNPARLLDTRPDYPTIDGLYRGMGPIWGLDVEVAGRGGVPAAGEVGSVVLNVAVTNPTAASFLTVWPAGEPRPTAANLNYVAGQTVPNLVVVKVNEHGIFSLYNYAGRTDVVVDVLGWFPREGSFVGMVPARLMDTRPGYPTIDQGFAGIGPLGPSGTQNLTVVGRTGVPAEAAAVALNVAVTNPTASSFLTVWPAGEPRPTAANLNFTRGQTVPNMVIAKVGAGGQISLFNLFGTTDVVVDILGWFPNNGSFVGLTPARLMDSRRTQVVPAPATTSASLPFSTTPPSTAPPRTTTPPPTAPPPADVYYTSCAAARAAGAAPLYRGQPGYRSGLDGDNDGVACE
jgi:hypothetical protein